MYQADRVHIKHAYFLLTELKTKKVMERDTNV